MLFYDPYFSMLGDLRRTVCEYLCSVQKNNVEQEKNQILTLMTQYSCRVV